MVVINSKRFKAEGFMTNSVSSLPFVAYLSRGRSPGKYCNNGLKSVEDIKNNKKNSMFEPFIPYWSRLYQKT